MLVESFTSNLACRKDDVKEEAKKGLRAVQVVDRTSSEDSTDKALLPAFPEMVSYVAHKVPSLQPNPFIRQKTIRILSASSGLCFQKN